ncbi:hypothetical protein TNCV_2666951 [Trichonephila clavipes]|nr:hypothetical protein TNCV_2666951 [Trichonephila clavipes]
MSRFGGLSEERPSVFMTRSKLGTHLSTQCSGDGYWRGNLIWNYDQVTSTTPELASLPESRQRGDLERLYTADLQCHLEQAGPILLYRRLRARI